MATVSSPLPPPVKNDWLPSGLDNPRLSPPSPGGPRKPAPTSQVKYKNRYLNYKFYYDYLGCSVHIKILRLLIVKHSQRELWIFTTLFCEYCFHSLSVLKELF